jgi:aminopeptidase N
MSTPRNLTQVAARDRAELIDVSGYDVSLDLAGESENSFRCTSTVTFACRRPGADVVVDVAAERLVTATLNGVAVPIDGYDSEHGLTIRGVAAENVLTIIGDFGFTAGVRGMVRAVDPADKEVYLFTSFEPAAAQLVFACFDQPDLKATFTFHVRIPTRWRAVSNMPEASREPTDATSMTVHFEPTPRMSTYLAVVCAGPFAEVRSSAYGRDLGVFCRPSMVEHLDADEVFDITRRGMDHFEKHFGQPYPLPKYDHVSVPGYPGAMENFGCITFGERLLIFRSAPTTQQLTTRAAIILHELAHMWFGDLVTMRWWDDLWLNEAFATWAAYWSMAEATELPEPWAVFALDVKKGGIEADQLSSTHPVCAEIPDVEATENNFDAITYRKGASVLKQLSAYVGIDTFTAALRSYFAERAWGNAVFDDLLAALVAASGRPVREFATVWLNTSQVNTLRPLVHLDDEGRYADVVIAQEAPEGHPTLRTHRIAIGLYDRDDGRLVRRERLELDVAGERTEVPSLQGIPAADVLLLNDDDLTYAKVRLDPRSMSTVLGHIGGFSSALPRAICWLAAVDMVSDAEMRARDFVTLVLNGLPAEHSADLVSSVLVAVDQALDLYADPTWAPQGWIAVAGMCRSAAYAAEPGSPLQLTWVRAFASAARDDADLAVLRDWYAGTDLPPGVVLDADLRWQLLRGLVAGGAAGLPEIEAEAERDNSISGRVQESISRALIPTIEAKQAAWRTITEDTSMPLETRLHAAHWYGHPAHTAATPDHVAQYLSTIDRLWTEQGSEIGRLFSSIAFPRAQVSEETVAALTAWESSGKHPPTLQRSVAEGRDQIRRALAARACDSAGQPA